jgi:hypothetical protein
LSFRCSQASEERGESLVGTASTVTAFLLVECPGPWGVEAVRDCRLPDEAKRWLQGVKAAGVRPLLVRGSGSGGTRVFLCRDGVLLSALLDGPADLPGLDLDGDRRLAAHGRPLFLVCTQGRHDACCAERGRPLVRAMAQAAPDDTWEVSHIGGDRFAANVLVLPEALYYGRVPPESAGDLVAAHRRGEVDLEHLRGRCSLPFTAQAAEIFLRRHLGVSAYDAVRPVGRDGPAFLFEVGRATWRVPVAATTSPAARLTCHADGDARAPHFELAGPITRCRPRPARRSGPVGGRPGSG